MFFADLKTDKGFKQVIHTIENMNLAFFITDIGGNIVYINKALEILTEYEKKDLMGKNTRVFKSNFHDKKFYENLWDTILSGNTWRGEILNKSKTDLLSWNTTTIIPIKDLDGEIIYFVSIRENVSIPKALSSPIIKEETFNSGPVILYNYYTNELATSYISPNIKDITGYSSEDFDNTITNLYSIVSPKDIEGIKKIIDFNKESFGVNHFELEFRVITKSEETIYLEGKVNIIRNAENEVVNYHGYFIDITMQKKLECQLNLSRNKFEIAMDSVGYGIWDWNIETDEVFYSKNWKSILGYENSDELNNINNWINSIHPLDKERILKNTERLINEENYTYEEEYRLKTKNDSYKWILSKGKVLERKGEKAIRIIGTHIDLTERKEKEEYKFKTKNLNSLGRLAGNIAHNFNNILMNIQGSIEMLNIQHKDNQEYFKDIEYSILRAKRLSKKMLVFARGGDPIKSKVNNLDKIIVKRVKSLFFKLSKHKLTFNIEEDLWNVNIDIDLFMEAIDNIIFNAIDAMPDKGKLDLSITNASALEDPSNIEKKYISISLKDNGKGIPDSILNKVFEPFFTTMPHKKEGVGLTTVNAIITKHNGHIYINSKENDGTEVKIFIPAFPKTQEEKKINNKKNLKLKVLVMDDEEIILKVTKKFLEKSGCTVELATNGEQAIKRYKNSLTAEKPFDIVIMDLIIVNGMDGEETIKELLKIDKNVKVIASSGYSNSKIMSNYQDYGFKSVLPKPYKMSALITAIKEI